MKTVHSEDCGLARVTETWFLEKDVAGKIVFNVLSTKTEKSSDLHWIGIGAGMKETDIWKSVQIKPKLS